jgi:DNA-binding CsgD family transcriptional regulator
MTRRAIGREEEVGAVEEFLGCLSDGPRALLLSGEPGIGKTAVWELGVAEAERRFGRVLTCRGIEAEASLSFAALSELLGPVLDAVAPALLAPRRRALEVALLVSEPGGSPPDGHAIGLAVLDVLRALAEEGPLVVALDDVQWLDPSSAVALRLALRRLRDEPVGMLATIRLTPEPPMAAELERVFQGERLARLSIGPLPLTALHKLLRDRVGLDLARPDIRRVWEATAGNPFFALELGRELARTGARPSQTGVVVRLPESLRELLGGRMGRLPAETTDVMLMVSALARPTVEVLVAADGDRERVLRALETAVGEGVVELDESQVRFEHPLLASLLYERAPIWKRRAVHRALAAALADVEERARHLALAAEGPDEAVADELDSAAELASARGATAAAADLSELAAALTSDPARSRSRQLAAADFHRLSGNAERERLLLEHLLEEVPAGPERADVLLPLAMRLSGHAPYVLRLFDEALTEASGDDARCARILAGRVGFLLFECDVRAALADARAALEHAERTDDRALLVRAIARLATAEGYAGQATPGLLERGIELERQLDARLEYFESPLHWQARYLMRFGELDRARAIFEELDRKAIDRGDEGSHVMVRWTLGMLEWLAGNWTLALEHARSAAELGDQTQHSHSRAWLARVKGQIEADLGLPDEARASVEESLDYTRTMSRLHTITALAVLGHLELALGNLQAAGEQLRELPQLLLAGGATDPTSPVFADTIETLVGLGELERARSYLEALEVNAAKLGSPVAVAAAARCRGLVAAADGDLDSALDAFDSSLSCASFPFDRARTLLCLGAVRLKEQQRRPAREALEQALAIFEELGARPWAEKAQRELRRISGRRTAGEELTATEVRVAELAARGRSNREIAAELYVARSTVEMHLSSVYRKLGIRSRTELARGFTLGTADEKTTEEAAKP